MSLIQTLEDSGAAFLTAVEHAAAWLVGTLASAETSLHALTHDSPLLAEAIRIGETAATAHGIPLVAIENVGGAVLQAAHDLVSGLTQVLHPETVPVPPAAA